MEERRHGDMSEHKHDGYDYWHPVSRMHTYGTPLPEGHVGNKAPDPEVSLEVQEKDAECYHHPQGLRVQPFNWTAWDDGCEAKGMCQGYTSIPIEIASEYKDQHPYQNIFDFLEEKECYSSTQNELHHRAIKPEFVGLVEPYWQCSHCRQLQKPIQWIQGARLESYWVETRGTRTVIWVRVSSDQWFVLVIRSYGTLQGVAMGIAAASVYAVGDKPHLLLPDECATILARRMWHRLTKGYWSDRKTETED